MQIVKVGGGDFDRYAQFCSWALVSCDEIYYVAISLDVDWSFIDRGREKMSFFGRGRLAREREAMEFTSYVRKEGRITLPKEVRDALSIEEGNLVKCKIEKVKARE